MCLCVYVCVCVCVSESISMCSREYIAREWVRDRLGALENMLYGAIGVCCILWKNAFLTIPDSYKFSSTRIQNN